MKPRLLIFHRTIAPYRIDFFNDLSEAFDTRICLQYKNLMSQNFNYEKIAAQFKFLPIYLPALLKIKGRLINSGYWKQLNDFNPDMVIVGEFGLDCLLVLLHRWIYRKKYKVVSICDDSYNMVAENNDFSHIHRMLRSKVVPKLDDLILVEPNVTDWYQQNFGKGIFFPIIKKDDLAREVYSKILPMSKETARLQGLDDKFVFLFVGRLVALKNVDTLIKAFSKLNRENTTLVIVGDGPEKNHLHELAVQSKADIRFTDRLEGNELYQWYNIANGFVLASYQESFGAVTNEALLGGCKGLISNKAGSQCLIENGKNGYTFNPLDVDELVQRMNQVIEEDNGMTDFSAMRNSQMLVSYDERMTALINKLKKNQE